MDIRIAAFDSPLYDQMLVQREAWLRIPLGLRWNPADRPGEAHDIHIAACEGDAVVGVMVLTKLTPGRIKMRQVAVDPNVQSRGIGKQMVAFAEQWALENEIDTIELNARETAVPFYLQQDYVIVSDLFHEVGIPHYKMEKKMRG